MITKYHAKYYANLLTQKAVGGELSSISQSLMSASVDINPHQIDAALFAFKSPLSKGIVLADEVGLGKTIEAGLVICQYWAIGKYDLLSQLRDGAPYRLSHPLAQYVLVKAMVLDTDNCNSEIVFNNKDTGINVVLPEYLRCKSGYLVLSKLQISSFEDEQYCLFSAFTEDGKFLTQEEAEKLFLCGATEKINTQIPNTIVSRLSANSKQHIITTIKNVDNRNLSFIKEEEVRIYRWERDVIDGIEQELDIVKRNIRETERLARQAENIEERISLVAKVEDLRRQKRRKRNELENREDEISVRRKELVAEFERKMIQTTSSDNLFTVHWSIN